MNTYFEAVVSYDKTLESGLQKKVSEHYLLKAETFSDAEYKIIEEMTPFISTSLFVKDIKRKQYSEVSLDSTADKWYECKVNLITLDEKSGAEKKSSTMLLVQASSSDNAASAVKILLADSMVDWEIHTIRETKYLELFQ